MSGPRKAAGAGMVPLALAGALDRATDRLVTPLGTVAALGEARAEVDAWLASAVAEARELGTPWPLIGEAVGITGEGARRRWGSR